MAVGVDRVVRSKLARGMAPSLFSLHKSVVSVLYFGSKQHTERLCIGRITDHITDTVPLLVVE